MMEKVLLHFIIHTQYYPPEIGAPQARLSDLAQELAENGFEVVVLTAMPNYPTGKFFSGYDGFFRQEQQGKVKVVRCGIYPSQTAQQLPRLLSYFSFVLSSLIIGLFTVGKADFWLTESPPLFLGLSGFLLSRVKHARWIFNVSDLWPETAVRLGVISDGLALSISKKIEAFCYRKAWLVSGQSQAILQDINSRFPLINTYHLSNGADTSLFNPDAVPAQIYQKKGVEVVALYAGLHGLAQGLEQILKIAPHFVGKIQFFLIGDGPEKNNLVELAERLNLTNVTFMDPILKKDIPGAIAAADICIVPLKLDLPGAVPSKIYEAMAASKPILLVAAGEAAEIVSANNAGVVVEPGDEAGLIEGLNKLVNDANLRMRLGANGRQAAVMKFDRHLITNQFVTFLQNAIR